MILFLLMNLILFSCAYLITVKFFKKYSLLDIFVNIFVIYLSQIILSEILLGVMGALSVGNLLLINGLVLVAAFLIPNKKATSINISQFFNSFNKFFKNKVALFILSIIIAFGSVKVGFN